MHRETYIGHFMDYFGPLGVTVTPLFTLPVGTQYLRLAEKFGARMTVKT